MSGTTLSPAVLAMLLANQQGGSGSGASSLPFGWSPSSGSYGGYGQMTPLQRALLMASMSRSGGAANPYQQGGLGNPYASWFGTGLGY